MWCFCSVNVIEKKGVIIQHVFHIHIYVGAQMFVNFSQFGKKSENACNIKKTKNLF